MVIQLKLVSYRPPFPKLAEQAPPHEIALAALQQKRQQKEEQKEATADATDPPEPAPKPKAGTGTNYNFNVQEQDKQHIELQKQHPDLQSRHPHMNLYHHPLNRNTNKRNNRCCSCHCNLNAQEQDKQHIELQKQPLDLPEQAPPHEIASAALNRKNSRKNSGSNNRCCSYPTARIKPKAGTGTNCSLNAQEQGKQHIELQKQYLDLPEQASPHEIASAALRNSRCCSHRTAQTKPKAGTAT